MSGQTAAPASLDEAVAQLESRFGLILSGAQLVRVLGYRTPSAFRQAVHRKTLAIDTFFVHGRRGRCARTRDVACWALRLGATSEELPTRPHRTAQ